MKIEGLKVRRVDTCVFQAVLHGQEVGQVNIAVGDEVWEVYRTVVDPAHEGRGIGSALVRYVLSEAEDEGVQVIPSCWYVDALMTRRSPRYDHLRVGAAPLEAKSGKANQCRIHPAVLAAS